jgi:hypothetical protein
VYIQVYVGLDDLVQFTTAVHFNCLYNQSWALKLNNLCQFSLTKIHSQVQFFSERRMTLHSLEALLEDLDGIEETEELHIVSDRISEHIRALENILTAKKSVRRSLCYVLSLLTIFQRVTFSDVSSDELEKAGIQRRLLYFMDAEIANLTKRLTPDTEVQIMDVRLVFT